MSKTIKAYIRKLYSTEYEEKEIELPDFLTDKQISAIERAIKYKMPILIPKTMGRINTYVLKSLFYELGIHFIDEHELETL